MLNERTRLSYLGLTECEVTVLRSLFQLVPELQRSFELTKPDDALLADVLFAEANNGKAMRALATVAEKNPLARHILVLERNAETPSCLHVRRPLVLKKLLAVLEQVTSTQVRASAAEVGARSHVLIVDDSYPVRNYMLHTLPVLTPMRLNLIEAESGVEAQNKFDEHRFDLVFLDVVMADTDGYKVCKWMKSRQRSTPVIMLTSRSGSFDKVRAAVAGCDGFITKPPQDAQLSAMLMKHLRVSDAPALEPA